MMNRGMDLGPDKLMGMSFGKIMTQEEFDKMRKEQGIDNTKVVKMPAESDINTNKEALRKRLREKIMNKRT